MRCVDERVENGVEEKLAKVVDGVGDEGGNAEVVGTRLAFTELELGNVDTGKIEEGVLVVCGELVFSLRDLATSRR